MNNFMSQPELMFTEYYYKKPYRMEIKQPRNSAIYW